MNAEKVGLSHYLKERIFYDKECEALLMPLYVISCNLHLHLFISIISLSGILRKALYTNLMKKAYHKL